MVVVQAEADLLEVIETLHSGGSGPDFLDGWKEQANENGDDRDDDEQLDQREGGSDAATDGSTPKDNVAALLAVARSCYSAGEACRRV